MPSKVEWISVDTITKGDTCWGSWDSFEDMTNRRWREFLQRVRRDGQYEDVKSSILRNGFRRASTYMWDISLERFIHLDGHHRLAAAIEIGYQYVPYRRVRDADVAVSKDSWMFTAAKEPAFRRSHSRILLHESNPRPLCLGKVSP